MKTLKSISKKVLVALLFVLTISSFAFAFGVNVRAEGSFPAEAKIEVMSGTSLKLNEKGGLRFIIKLNGAAKKHIKDDDATGSVKLVAYIAPIAIVNKGDEYLIANGLKAEVAEGKLYQVEGDDNWYANVCPVDFKEANRKLDYSVKAFVMNGETVEATSVLNDEARGNIYDVATRALLDETEDYTQKILDLAGYKWLGTEQFPIYIDSAELYNGLVSKINADFDFSEKYVAIASSVNTSGATLAEGKTLPVNNYKVSRVTFMDGETVLGSVLAKEGEKVSFAAPEKTADETYKYTFMTWVTANGGDEEADLTSVSQDMTVYAKYNQIYINAITLSAENVKYGNNYSVKATAKYGIPVLTFSKEENGEYKAWNELENRDAGTYYVKATVVATEEYDGAEKMTSFKVEQAENAITSFDNVPETISCNETLAPTATATHGEVKIKYVKADDTLCDTFEEAKGEVVGNNVSYRVQAVVGRTENYAGAAQEKIFKITHDFVDGVCKNCNKPQTGIKYATTETVAYITGYEGNPSTEVYPVAVYEGKPVTYVAQEAFNKQTITKIVLPESVTDLGGRVFLNCSKLEYVSMIGVKSLKYNVTGRPDGKNESNNNFLYCNKLETVIVSPDFNTEVQQFNTDQGVSPLSLYVNGESGAPVLTKTDNLFSGKVYYKGDATKCGQWNFDANGELKHGPASHNFVNGICENCGRYGDELTQGVVYGYNAAKKCYYVGDNKALKVAEVNILSKYNDGVNGEAEVKYLAFKAFQGNTNITKIILPSSVDSLEGWVFGGCAKLEYVSMTGITKLDYASPYGGARDNNFRECFKLKVVIVSNALSSNVGQFGCGATDAGNKKILDFYVDGASGAPSLDYVTADANNLCSGVVYYKGDATKCGQWNYVDGELKHGAATHNFVDGVCKDCGRVQSETVTYAYDATKKCYYVTGVSAKTESELYIRATYNDGSTNGDAPVSYVKWGAFMDNEVITKVILPTSVTDLHGNVFLNCSNLEYVSMKGVKRMYATNGEAREDRRWGDNNFRNCNKLKYVVIGSEGLDSTCGQFNSEKVPNPTILNIYVEGTTGTVSLNSGDALWTGNVYYYSDIETAGTWHYVNGIPTLW